MIQKTVDVPPSLEAVFEARGLLSPKTLKRDGVWHPLDAVDDAHGEGNGRYCVPVDEPLVVHFQNWKDGADTQTWSGNGHARKIPPEELAAMQAEDDQARADRQARAAKAARTTWEHAEPATPDHPYLKAKGIKKADGLRVKSANPLKGWLCIPMFECAGDLVSLQYIAREPDAAGKFPRKFHPGALRRATFAVFGEWPPKGDIVVAEGAATAISIHESTGGTVIAAMDAGNLLPTAEALKQKYPKVRFTFFADNDASGVGLAKAIKAAEAVDGKVCMAPREGDDANDLFRREGPGAVKALLASAKPVGAWTAEQTEGRDPSLASAGTGVDGVRPAHSPATSLFVPLETLMAEQPPREWLVKGLLDARETGEIFGPSGSGKTFVAYDLAGAHATGGTWCEHAVRPGTVLYVAQEGAGQVANRFRAWEMEHGQKIPDGTVHVSTVPIHLTREGAAEINAERERIKATYGAAPTLVIIDTLAKTMWPGGKENDTGDMALFMENVASIGRGERCLKLVIHHSGHTNTDRSRGASSGPAALDFEMRVQPGQLTFTKQRDLPLPATAFRFRLVDYVVGQDEDGDDVTSCAVVWDGTCTPAGKMTMKPGKHTGVLRATLEAAGRRATKETWRDRFREVTPNLRLNASKTAFNRGVEEMVAAGQVRLNGDMYELVSRDARLERLFNASAQTAQAAQQRLMSRAKPCGSSGSHSLRSEPLEPLRRNGPAKGKKKARPGDDPSRRAKKKRRQA